MYCLLQFYLKFSQHTVVLSVKFWKLIFYNDNFQETSFASNQPVTRSLSSVTSNNKSKLPLPTSVNGQNNSVSNQNRINNAKKTDLERISPWLVSSEAITTKKEKEKSKIPQLKTVITTELWFNEKKKRLRKSKQKHSRL